MSSNKPAIVRLLTLGDSGTRRAPCRPAAHVTFSTASSRRHVGSGRGLCGLGPACALRNRSAPGAEHARAALWRAADAARRRWKEQPAAEVHTE
jgi:hypothetical protein